jgi:CubicO group peptidase (beta-lactamase class C family)/ketosteroid isomerase-like protein
MTCLRLFALAALLVPTASVAQESADSVATDPEARVDQLMAKFTGNETPGVVVGVVEHGGLVFQKAYGMANLTDGIAFQTDTRSNIGSVTKQFTAMGILLLQEEGKLSVDDDVRKYIPELKDFGVPVSLRNLLNHTGGYREVYNLMRMTGYQGEDALRRDQVIQVVQRQPELQAEPNTEFNYNNTGFILLATTIERVSEMTFPDYMKERVFEPLGMMDTRVKSIQGEVIPHSSQGYAPVDTSGVFRQTRDLAASYGAGGIYTTVEDLSRWMMNYRDASLGGPDAIHAITTRTILNNGDSTSYGMGMGIGTFRGRTLFSHTGGDVAHRAYFGYYPELESGVILMSNNATFGLAIGTTIAAAFFGDEMEPVLVAEEQATGGGPGMSPERMEKVAGRWRITTPAASLDIEYTVDEGELYAQATGQPRFKVVPNSDSTAVFDGVNASVTFHFEEDGTVTRATHHQGGAVPMARVDRVELTFEQLRAYQGRYYSAEIETAYEIRLDEEAGNLQAHSLRLPPLTLTYVEDDEFRGAFGKIIFERSGDDVVTGFKADNGRTRDVSFVKQDPLESSSLEASAQAAIRAARDLFNQAIVDRDLGAIDGLLMGTYHIVSGRSSQDSGHDANVAVWRTIFDSDPDVLYVRTPRKVRVNKEFGLAEELGNWAGNYTSNGHPGEASGVYAAKWQRAEDGRWLLQSEVFTTLECSGGPEVCRGPDPIT